MTLYGHCPDCGGNMTHRATDGKCPLRIRTTEHTPEQTAELEALLRPSQPHEDCDCSACLSPWY